MHANRFILNVLGQVSFHIPCGDYTLRPETGLGSGALLLAE